MDKKRSRDEESSDVEKKAKRLEPSTIKNKMKRGEVYAKLKHEKKMEKEKRHMSRDAAEKRALELGEEPPKPKVPRTIENTQESDETVCKPDNEELFAYNAADEEDIDIGIHLDNVADVICETIKKIKDGLGNVHLHKMDKSDDDNVLISAYTTLKSIPELSPGVFVRVYDTFVVQRERAKGFLLMNEEERVEWIVITFGGL